MKILLAVAYLILESTCALHAQLGETRGECEKRYKVVIPAGAKSMVITNGTTEFEHKRAMVVVLEFVMDKCEGVQLFSPISTTDGFLWTELNDQQFVASILARNSLRGAVWSQMFNDVMTKSSASILNPNVKEQETKIITTFLIQNDADYRTAIYERYSEHHIAKTKASASLKIRTKIFFEQR